MFLAWGDELCLLYNDAYTEILGARHPAALGQPLQQMWPEIWDDIAPLIAKTFAGEAVFHENMPLRVLRHGYEEAAWFTFSYSPVLDDTGKVGGLFCALTETTTQIALEHSRIAETERLRRLFAQAPSMMIVLRGPEHVFELANASYIEWIGHRDVMGKRVADVAPEVVEQGFITLLDRVYATGEPFTGRALPITLRRADGKIEQRFLDLVYQPITDEDGTVSGIFSEGVDVTERVKAAEALRADGERRREAAAEALAAAAANAKFRTFFEQGSYFAAVMTLDGAVIEANRLSVEACGYLRENVLGRKFWECGWWSPSALLVREIQEACTRAAAGLLVRMETAYYTAAGEERVVDIIFSPVRDQAGHMLFIAPTGTDITERRRVEERLRLLDRMSDAARAATDSLTIMLDTTRLLGEFLKATRVAYADVEQDNNQFTIRYDWTAVGASSTVGVYSLALFGSRATADMQRGRTLVIHDVDRELLPDEGANMFNSIGIKSIVCCPLVKAGSLVAMMAVHSAVPRHWSDEEVALVKQVVDRSWAHIERVRTTEALRESDRRKTEFLATLAHELRNPLAPIQTGLDLMRVAGDSPAAMARARPVMERQLAHMVRLIDDLLDVARITRGKVALKKERMPLQAMIASAIETSQPLIEAGRHVLQVHLPDEPLMLHADPTRIAQVVGNLLNNAAKYTAPGGDIRLQARRDGGNAVVSVSDSGVGIREELLTAVFDMFTQDRRNIDRAQGGLGIGLTLVRRLVELHGGTVTATSPGPGKGSTFTVVLPLAIGSAQQSAPETSAQRANPSAGLRILVVDDNVDAADALASLLALGGHVTREAHDGSSALAQAEAFHPDVAFLDIGMPGMDGYEVARALRRRPDTAHMVLIALTGWGAATDRAESRAAGFDHHLTKPAGLAEIEALLNRIRARDAASLH